jgi:amino acid transporter
MAEKTFEHAGLKAGFSGAVAIGWLVFLILFLAFFSEGFRINEKFAIILLSIFIIAVLLGGFWLYWSFQMMSKKDWELFRIKGFKWRIIGTLVFFFALLSVLIYGFWYIWTDFNFWQYVAIFLIIILVGGGLMGAVWAPWSNKHKDEMDKYGKEIGKKFEEGFKESFEKKDKKDEFKE